MSVSFEKIKSEFKLLQEKKDNITKILNNISLIKQKQEKQKNDKSENTSKLVSLVEKEEYFLKNT
jgi:inhibitor of KinA sporulation pathway (predicted exonuclease)